MKRAIVFFMILTLSISTAACGSESKDNTKSDTKTKQSQKKDDNKDKEQKNSKADNKIYTLSSDDDVWTINVSAPKDCSEADYSSETARAFESIGSEEGSSIQYVMTLRNVDISTAESDMKEEVQYLYTANSDGDIPEMQTKSEEHNGKIWNYFSYSMEELKGYRVWVELSDGDVFACTVEWIGDGQTQDNIDVVIQTLASCIADYDVQE